MELRRSGPRGRGGEPRGVRSVRQHGLPGALARHAERSAAAPTSGEAAGEAAGAAETSKSSLQNQLGKDEQPSKFEPLPILVGIVGLAVLLTLR